MNPSTSPQTWQLTENERQNLQTTIDYSAVQSVPEIWSIAAQRFAQIPALHDPHAQPSVQLDYTQLLDNIQRFAAGLQAIGIESQADDPDPPRIALFSDNNPRWFVADQGIMMAGGVDVVRSSQADREELLYILNHSGSQGLVVENLETLRQLRSDAQSEFPFTEQPIAWVVLLSDETVPEGDALKILNYSQLLEIGANAALQPAQHQRETLATLIYTSGTTGKPKGVMLTHGNLLHQIETFGSVFPPTPGDRVLGILPSWHAYERSVEYFVLSQGCTLTYTNIRHFKTDLKDFQPQLMVGVPRLWESIYEGVQKQFRSQPANKQKLVNFLVEASCNYLEARRTRQGMSLQMPPPSRVQRLGATLKMLALLPLHRLGERLVYQKVRSATGGRVKFLISGGGSLAQHIDDFFEIVGINLLVGYGLTETAPVLSVRRTEYNLQGSAGKPIVGTQLKIVNPETRQSLPLGERGLVLAKGPQIMRGYYRNPEATQKAIDPEGWFDTGDLGLITGNYDLVLTGRAKDTIVLSNGENIEPQPIEDACVRSPYIDQIMLVGQDQKQLGALIVPNLDALEQWANQQGIPVDLDSPAVQNLFRQELAREVKNRPGYRPDDRIGVFRPILEPFSMENGMMTQTLKIKRPVVMERYGKTIEGMFA
jgi:long-chain acyl-CoA synthetase